MRRAFVTLVALGLLAAACGGGAANIPSSTTGALVPATTTSIATTTPTSTTTIAPTTTLSLEQLDTAAAVVLWDGLTDAWEAGPEAAARYTADHSYPGMPAAYEDCLEPELTAGWGVYVADASTMEADPGWSPDEVDIDVGGRIYAIDVTFDEGGRRRSSNVHVSIADDGGAYFFFVCEPAIPGDALAYRLQEGSAYTHQVTYRADIAEDQRNAEGVQATGRETWTLYREFDVTSDDGRDARVTLTITRVIWDMFAGGHHLNSFDTDTEERRHMWYGVQGDLALDVSGWMVEPEGTTIDDKSSFSFLDLPAVAVVEGDTWESEWDLNSPSLSGTMTVTATRVGADEVQVSFEGAGSGIGSYGEPPEVHYELRTDATISGTAVIDFPTGWLRSMDVDILAEGTTRVTANGFWGGIRPLWGSETIWFGPEMPTTYTIRIETRTIEG